MYIFLILSNLMKFSILVFVLLQTNRYILPNIKLIFICYFPIIVFFYYVSINQKHDMHPYQFCGLN